MTSEYELSLPPKTLENTDPRTRAVLEKAKAQTGFIPNMYGGMANSPGMLETYLDGIARFRKESGFSRAEQEAIRIFYCDGHRSFSKPTEAHDPIGTVRRIRRCRIISPRSSLRHPCCLYSGRR